MVEAMRRYESALPPEMLKRMADSCAVFSQNKQQLGMEFYQILFKKYPNAAAYFWTGRHGLLVPAPVPGIGISD